MVLGPLGIPGCAPLSYRGSLSSSPSPLPASPSARRAGTLTAAPQSASSPLPDRVQSRCSHFLRNRQFSAPLRVGHQRQSGPPADYCGASAAGNGGRRPPASSPRSQRPAGGGRAPPNLARRPCRRYRAPGPSSPAPQARRGRPPCAAAERAAAAEDPPRAREAAGSRSRSCDGRRPLFWRLSSAPGERRAPGCQWSRATTPRPSPFSRPGVLG